MQIEVTGVAEALEAVEVERKKVAMVRALNRGIRSGRTRAVRDIARETGMRQADIRREIRMEEATGSRLVASLGASRKKIPLVRYRARGPHGASQTNPVPSRGRGRGVAYAIGPRRGRIQQAFIAQMRSGHVGVFERHPTKFMRVQRPTWKHKRQAIREKFGPSLWFIFQKNADAAKARAWEMFLKNLDHELGFAKVSEGLDAGAD